MLDASGSMNSELPDGTTRFDAARDALIGMVGRLPPTISLALRVYGHQSDPEEKNCGDTELVLPFGPAAERADEIDATVSGLAARGYTPISLSLQKAAEDLAAHPESANTIILVSDGKETCRADPCAVAKALAAAHAGLVVHTVGFGVDSGTRLQLQCIANVARGNYYDARSMRDLADKLVAAAAAPIQEAAPEPAHGPGILTIPGIAEAGVEVVDSESGQHAGIVGTVGGNRLELPAGIYTVMLTNGAWTGVEIRAGETTKLVPAFLEFRNPAAANMDLIDPETGEDVAAIFQQAGQKVALVPGTYELKSSSGFSFGTATFEAGRKTVVTGAIVRVRMASPPVRFFAIRSLTTGERGLDPVDGEDLSLPEGSYEIFDPNDEGFAPVGVEVAPGEIKELDLR
ncbi:MAG: VWA domain-containing protein [Hyphomicrobiaceae bacterium]